MSYTSSDPEYFNRDPDSSSLASTSTTTASDKESKKKKPWSKFKSSIKNIGEKMSSKPSKFTDPTESSEQKRVKKGKRGKASGEPKPQTTTEEPPRAKSPTKNLMKKLSVESLSTPFVGYQPASVSPTKSYAKALHKSGSTSESNLSASDIDTPKKSLTLDRNIKLAQESPDSGRASQTLGSLESSRPPSSIKEVASDMSGDSDYTSPRQGLEEKFLGDLVTKTEQFAQSLVSPKGKEQDNDVTVEFLKAETVLKTPTKTDESPEVSGNKTDESSSKNEAPSGKDDKTEKASSLVDQQKVDEDTLGGGKKKDRVRDNKKEDSLGLIASEQSTATPTKPTYAEAKDNIGETSSKRPEEKSTSEKNTVEDFGNDGKNSNKASKDVKNNDTKTKSEIKPTLTNDEKGINEKPEIKLKTELKSETTDERTDNTLSPKQQKSIDLDKKDDKPKTPTKDDKSKTPTKDDEPKTPTKDDKSKTPTKDDEPKTPTKDDKSKTVTKDNEPKTSTKDDKSKTPTKDDELKIPTKDDKSKTPTKDDEPKTPTKDDKSKTPTKDDEPKTPTKDDKSKTPTKDDKLKTPTKDDKSKTPTIDDESKTSTTDDKSKTLTKDDELKTPTKDDKSKTLTKDDESKTPTKDDKSKTPTKDDELKTQTKSDSEKSTPPTPTKIQDVPSSLTDIDPKSQASMSVEEKLQAFLSSEGWSGTFKNVPAKSTDGSQPDKRECLYKILVIGELGTGKTSIIKRYVHQFFSQHYRATIGVDFALKVLNWDQNTIIRLQLWDIAGQERFGNMTRVYYKEAVGAFIVFDVTRSATFDAVLKWKQDLDSKVQLSDGSHIPCVLLANKCDQQKEGIVNTPAKMDEYCKENNFSAWFETSAKENINIDEAAKSLVTQILQNDKSSQNGKDSARDGGKFPLDGKSEQESKSCAC